jgi:rubrerythrin
MSKRLPEKRVVARPVLTPQEEEARQAFLDKREEERRRAREWVEHYDRIRTEAVATLRRGVNACPGGTAAPQTNYGVPHTGERWWCPVCGYRVRIGFSGFTNRHVWKGVKPEKRPSS